MFEKIPRWLGILNLDLQEQLYLYLHFPEARDNPYPFLAKLLWRVIRHAQNSGAAYCPTLGLGDKPQAAAWLPNGRWSPLAPSRRCFVFSFTNHYGRFSRQVASAKLFIQRNQLMAPRFLLGCPAPSISTSSLGSQALSAFFRPHCESKQH